MTTEPSGRMPDRRIAFVGGGRMALALAEGFVTAGLLAANEITVYDPAPAAREQLAARIPGIQFADSATDAARSASLIGLAVKPQQAAAADKGPSANRSSNHQTARAIATVRL